MKKTTQTSKKLLLSAQKIRELTPEKLEDVVGGMGCPATSECDNGSCRFSRIGQTGVG